MGSIHASLSVPIHGSMEFILEADEARHAFQVSYTPNDFLHELLSALILVATGGEGVAVAHTEPTVFEFVFSPGLKSDLLSLNVNEYPNGSRTRSGCRSLFAVQGSVESVVVAFWRAVRRLQSEITSDVYREAMRREFPTGKVRELSELLGKT